MQVYAQINWLFQLKEKACRDECARVTGYLFRQCISPEPAPCRRTGRQTLIPAGTRTSGDTAAEPRPWPGWQVAPQERRREGEGAAGRGATAAFARPVVPSRAEPSLAKLSLAIPVPLGAGCWPAPELSSRPRLPARSSTIPGVRER